MILKFKKKCCGEFLTNVVSKPHFDKIVKDTTPANSYSIVIMEQYLLNAHKGYLGGGEGLETAYVKTCYE